MAKKIMIVEDNELNMKLFHDLLKANGFDVVGTHDGRQAVELARGERPDLILMDIQLPEVSGLDVTAWLKDDDELQHIPVIAVTAFAMKGDEERIRQVLNNLVSNAIKYSPEGGFIRIGGWYEAANQGHDDRVVFYVADEGIGIPSDELPHIFDRFYRVDSSLRRTTDGAGLGLFLCKAIAEAHGGEIWVRSEQDKGTTFFIALPVDADAVASAAARATGATPPPAAT